MEQIVLFPKDLNWVQHWGPVHTKTIVNANARKRIFLSPSTRRQSSFTQRFHPSTRKSSSTHKTMSYTESACAIDLSLQSLLQRHSLKETGADIWRQHFHSVDENIRLRPSTRRRIDGVFKFIHFGGRFRIYAFTFHRLRVEGRPKRIKKFAFTSVCVYNRLRVDRAWVSLIDLLENETTDNTVLYK